MATVYKIDIETTSAFVSYSEQDVKTIFENFLKNFKDDKTKLGFECATINVNKLA